MKHLVEEKVRHIWISLVAISGVLWKQEVNVTSNANVKLRLLLSL